MQELESRSVTPAATRFPKRVALVVLGMHRSGTSALTRVLNLLGAELSGDLLPANAGNPLGYWESAEGVALHDSVLAELGSSWDSLLPFSFERLTSPAAQRLRAGLLELLRRDFGTAPLFVIKDPRICRLVPLWLDLLHEFGAEPRFILSIRHPGEVADSLARRDGMARDKAMFLWLRYVLEAERDTRGCPRTVLLYPDLVRDWRAAITRVGQELAIEWPRSPTGAAPEIDRFIAPELHRNRIAEDDKLQDSPWAHLVWREFAMAPAEGWTPGPDLERAHQFIADADSLFAPVVHTSQTNLAVSQAEILRSQVEIARLAADLATSRTEVDRLQAETDKLQAEVARLVADLATTQADNLGWQQEIARLVDDIRLRKAEIYDLTKRLDAILRSNSWRITAPLRAIGRRILRR
jgi:hypothetical protein